MGIKRISELPELTEAVGDETVVGTSGSKVVRIPVGDISGSKPIVLRNKSTAGFAVDKGLVYADGSSINGDDILNAFLAGTPMVIGYWSDGSSASELALVISVRKLSYVTEVKAITCYKTTSTDGTTSIVPSYLIYEIT